MIQEAKMGMRVRVQIRGTLFERRWDAAAVTALEGTTGMVLAVCPEVGRCLVVFDKAVRDWTPNAVGRVTLASWYFPFAELVEASVPTSSNASELRAVGYSDELLPRTVDLLFQHSVPGSDALGFCAHALPAREPVGLCVEQTETPRPTCLACKAEAELGTEDIPHPVDPRVHSCLLDRQGTAKYVAGFLFDPTFRYVAMVLKKRPAWQADKWNAVGGHVEDGEPAGAAMAREFHEEAGILHYRWQHFATIVADGAGAQLNAYFAVGAEDEYIRSNTDEQVDWLPIKGVREGQWPVVTNTRWLLEMALSICQGDDPCRYYLVQEGP